MAHGIPVLTSNRSSLPEVAGDAALLVDPHSVDSISFGLQRLIEDAAFRQQLSRLGIARAKLFPWTRAVQETYDAYVQLLG
jgi:glycosyltransferase involved in cell wall biosynthesis